MKGYLPDTCVCRVCQSQLDWREIPGCGPDCGHGAGPATFRGAAPADSDAQLTAKAGADG